jgi:hypothetical protein
VRTVTELGAVYHEWRHTFADGGGVTVLVPDTVERAIEQRTAQRYRELVEAAQTALERWPSLAYSGSDVMDPLRAALSALADTAPPEEPA